MVFSQLVKVFVVSAALVFVPRVDVSFQRPIPRVLGTLGLPREVKHHFVKVLVFLQQPLTLNHLCDNFGIRFVLGRESLAPLFFPDSVHLLFHPAFEGVGILLAVLRCAELLGICVERATRLAYQ